MEIEVRIAKVEDVEGIQEVQYKTWLVTYPNEEIGILKEDIETRFRDRYSEEKLEKRREEMLHPGNSRCWVAKDDDRVIGFARAEKFEDKNQLQAIYVLPEYQGQGIGGLLWKEIKTFFGREKDIFVEVADYNENAIKFYEKLGFKATGRHWEDERFRMKRTGRAIPEIEMVIKADGK